MMPLRAVNAADCGGCPAWLAPLVTSAVTPGQCLQRTVPLGDGCRMPRLQSEGDERAAGVPFVEDPDWRD